ncbi:MAG: hypothetical protein HYV09_07200 [Deltaproteobacteria bacterium]|nr:hypothetical protein [Deltaproteobacteria bacterium]
MRRPTRPPAKPDEIVAPREGPYGGLREGLVVAAKYRLVEVRGEGAMGAVWSAIHLTLGHTVAIKFLNVYVPGSICCGAPAGHDEAICVVGDKCP